MREPCSCLQSCPTCYGSTEHTGYVALAPPAVALVLEFVDDKGIEVVQPVIALGLTAAGDVDLLVTDGEGFVEEAGRGLSDYRIRPQRQDEVLR